jgi:hypothetical protein
VIGDALRVVAGRAGDDAGAPLLRREPRELVERAALLERGGELQISESVRECASGVRSTAPAIVAAAARTSARVTGRERALIAAASDR